MWSAKPRIFTVWPSAENVFTVCSVYCLSPPIRIKVPKRAKILVFVIAISAATRTVPRRCRHSVNICLMNELLVMVQKCK